MHKFLAAFLILFAGWTLSSNLAVLSGQSLEYLIVVAPFVICSLALIYVWLSKEAHAVDSSSVQQTTRMDYRANSQPSAIVLLGLCLAPAILYLSWTTFWVASVIILAYCILRRETAGSASTNGHQKPNRREWAVVLFFTVGAVVLTLAVSRSDLDDAFYVAVAAFTSGHPSVPLLAFDPMHGDGNLPLIFPSYQFASFELLAGALAHLFGIPAMDVMYRILPPLWAVLTVFSIFLLAQEIMPKRWLMLGVMTLVLMAVLGECHRAPANFMFVRLFQGKAVYLSVVVPAIFYLMARYLSDRGTRSDLFLLGCAQLTAIGLTNFGMLAAPMAAVGALISNIPILQSGARKKLRGVLVTLSIPLPYLIAVGAESNFGSSMVQIPSESASDVWMGVFGSHQQFLIAILLLAGPVLANDKVTRFRLAIPSLILFAIYLNPWFSDFISKNITTPPVYWRVIWSFPILIFAAASICILIDRLLNVKDRRSYVAILLAVIVALLAFALPSNTFRSENIGVLQDFAGRKIQTSDYATAEKAIQISRSMHRLLAPDEIAGVISRFESHPKLVSVRSLYLDLLAPSLGSAAYLKRRALHDFVSATSKSTDEVVRAALISLDVSTIVMPQANESKGVVMFLKAETYEKVEILDRYSIWHKATQ